mgnify:CR=1 FL=1
MKKIFVILKYILRPISWLCSKIWYVVKKLIKSLPDFRKWFQTFIYYMALALGVFVVSYFAPIPISAKLIIVVTIPLIFSIFSNVRMKKGFSEEEITKLRKDNENLSEELNARRNKIKKLEEDQKNQKIELIDLQWIFELSLASLRIKKETVFDYFKRKGEEAILWKDKPKDLESEDERFIGALKFDYESKIGMDLREALVEKNDEDGLFKYWLPCPKQISVADPSEAHWSVKAHYKYDEGKLFGIGRGPMWYGDEQTDERSLWGEKESDELRNAMEVKELDDTVGIAIQEQARGRMNEIIKYLLGQDAQSVKRKEDLKNPIPFSKWIENQKQGIYCNLEDSISGDEIDEIELQD